VWENVDGRYRHTTVSRFEVHVRVNSTGGHEFALYENDQFVDVLCGGNPNANLYSALAHAELHIKRVTSGV